MNKKIDFFSFQKNCSNCTLRPLCITAALDDNEISKIDEIVHLSEICSKGQKLNTQGQVFKFVFIIKTGSAKTYTMGTSGQQHITGFHFPGDLVGLNGLNPGIYQDSMEALGSTFPNGALQVLIHTFPNGTHPV